MKSTNNIQYIHFCHFLKLTIISFYHRYTNNALSLFSFWLLVLLTSSCDFENMNLPNSGQYQLFAIDRHICRGMLVQFYLIDQKSGKTVDFSEFTFEPIPPNLGEIDPNGLYKAPDNITTYTAVQIKVKGKLNRKITSSYNLNLAPTSNLNVIDKIPHQVQSEDFLDLSESNEFLFGSPPIGTGPAKNISSESKVIDKYGQVKWGHYYGPGQITSGFFYKENSLVSGYVYRPDAVMISKIYDPFGNDLKKAIQEKMFFGDYFVDISGYLYVTEYKYRWYKNPTNIVKLSPDFEILKSYSLNYSIQSFLINQDESVVAYYVDESRMKSGVVKFDPQGLELWNLSFPYNFPNQARLVALNDQKYGLVKAECNNRPCETELKYYEIGVSGELINPGQTIVSSISSEKLLNNPSNDLNNFYISVFDEVMLDIIALKEEVFVVFHTYAQNYKGIMIKSTQGSTLAYWWAWDLKDKGQTSLKHVKLTKSNNGLEWKTICGKAICTFQLERNLAFNPCF